MCDIFPLTYAHNNNSRPGCEVNLIRLSGALWAHWHISAPKALLISLERYAVVLAATTAAVVIAVVYLRHRRMAQALRNRVSFDLLPTTGFDPSAEEILRFARQLQRVRLAAAGMTPRRATSVRISIYTGEQGRMTYRIEGAKRTASALSQQAYPHVELRAVNPAPDPEAASAEPTAPRAATAAKEKPPTAMEATDHD